MAAVPAAFVRNWCSITKTVVARSLSPDPQWRLTASAVRSSEIYNGEEFDARAELPGWDTAGFEAGTWVACGIAPTPPAKLVAQIDPPIRTTLTLPAKRILQPRPGVFVCDFGQNFSGWCRLHVKGPSGTTVQLRYAEILKPQARLIRQTCAARGDRSIYVAR